MLKRYPLVVFLMVYWGLVSLYSFNTPLLEAPDAYYHFAVIEHVGRTGTLPPLEDPNAHPWQQIVFHAPLYYMTAGLLIGPLDTSDFPDAYRRNPHAQIGEPHTTHNHNFVAHVGSPWHKTRLAVYIVRFYSMVLGALTLSGVYCLARHVAPHQPQLAALACGLLLMHPQFLFTSGVVTNDAMVMATSTWALVLTMQVIRQRLTPRRILMLGILVALASLSKTSGLIVLPIAVLALLWTAYKTRMSKKNLLAYLVMLGGIWLVLAAWWYIRNWLVLGEPFATTALAEATGSRMIAVDWLAEMRGLYYSYWGLFGWFNISAPQLFYTWVTALLALSAVGSLWGLFRYYKTSVADDRIISALLVLALAFLIIPWTRFNLIVPAGQGRLWFPAISIFTLGIAWGLMHLPRAVVGMGLAGMATATLAFPALLIAPAYSASPPVSVQDWVPPAKAIPIMLREPWQDNACLRLWVEPLPALKASSEVEIKLAWETLCPLSGYWSEFFHWVDLRQMTCQAGDTRYILSQYDTMPAGGNQPVPSFKPNTVVEEIVRLEIPAGMSTAGDYALALGLYDASGSFIRILTTNARGEILGEGVAISVCSADVIILAISDHPLFADQQSDQQYRSSQGN